MKLELIVMIITVACALPILAGEAFEKDIIKTSDGDLEITFVGHGTLILKFNGKTIHVDPYGHLDDYAELPKADAIVITHEHPDHLDPAALKLIRTLQTVLVATERCKAALPDAIIMKNGDSNSVLGVGIEAIPAYNIVNKRDNGMPFHPKGSGNGYIFTFGDKRVYVAGDTENTPEMKALKGVDCAFLPMNLPYTMTPEMVADAAKAFKPGILYPYHYGDTDPARLVELLKDSPGIEVRIRRMR